MWASYNGIVAAEKRTEEVEDNLGQTKQKIEISKFTGLS